MEKNLTKAEIVERLLENKSITAAEAVVLLQENQQSIHYTNPYITPYLVSDDEEMVAYGTYCSCNPANGGSGLCGCIMGNQLVPKRKGYIPGTITTINTTANGQLNMDTFTKSNLCACNPKNGGSGSCGCK